MKTKHILIALVIILVGWAWRYLVSPLFVQTEINESSPLENSIPTPQPSFDDMSFEEAMEQTKDVVVEIDDLMEMKQPSIKLIAQWDVVQADSFHRAQWQALLIDTPDWRVLRYQDFETINGPNLHVYLSTDVDATDFVDIGPLKATKGNINYSLPDGIDTEKYRYALVRCVPFGVLFNYVELQ